MSRIRTIQPHFPRSTSMTRVSRDARLLFVQLWLAADDAGRLRAAPLALAAQQQYTLSLPTNFHESPGFGVAADMDGHHVLLG